jgi:predicted component of type VI protein secretion system
MQQLLKTHDRHSTPHPHFLPKFPRVRLEIMRGRARDRIRQVPGRTFFIGSGSDCDLVLGDDHFPELHSYLLLTAQAVVIRHLGQPPGLCVNGRPHSRAALTDQSRIQIGPYEFTIHIAAGQPAAATLPLHLHRHAAPLPSTLLRKNNVLPAIEKFLDSMPTRPAHAGAGLKLLNAATSVTDWENMATPVSVGLVAPSVKPPPWRHMSTTPCACQY